MEKNRFKNSNAEHNLRLSDRRELGEAETVRRREEEGTEERRI